MLINNSLKIAAYVHLHAYYMKWNLQFSCQFSPPLNVGSSTEPYMAQELIFCLFIYVFKLFV